MRGVLCAGAFLLLLGCSPQGTSLSLDALGQAAAGGDRAAVEKLVGLLGSRGELSNDRVYALLVTLKSADVVPALVGQVASADAVRREYVIAALGNHKDPAAVASIASVLSDRSLSRRYVAAWALGEIGGEPSIAALLGALSDPQEEVRKAATRALIRQQRIALQPLIGYLPSAQGEAVGCAIRALGDIGSPEAFDVLAARVSQGYRAEVILALGKIRDPRGEPLVLEALRDGQWRVRMHAAMALGDIGSAIAVPQLEAALGDEVNVVREWAARSLEKVTGRRYSYRNESGEMVAPYNIYH